MAAEAVLVPQIAPKDFAWEWVSSSLPWIDPLKEAQAQIMLLGANLESEVHLLKQQGRDFRDVIAERKQAAEIIQQSGLIKAMELAGMTTPAHDPALTTALLTQQQEG